MAATCPPKYSRQGVDYDVRADAHGPGCNRRRKGRIDHQQGVLRLREFRGATDIRNAQQRIGRRFQPQHARIVAHRGLDLGRLGGVDRCNLDAQPGQGLACELGGAWVIGIADDEMIALAQMRQHHCRARGHAGSKGYAGFGLLEDGEFLFELPGGRVVPAGVDKRSFRGQVVRRETDFLVDHESARHFQAGSRCPRGRIRIFAAVD